jgi:hypothetical protein
MSDKRTNRLSARAKKTSAAATQRVIKDATVQFRLDQESMSKLLELADEQRTGVGVICRNWVLDRLQTGGGNPSISGINPDLMQILLGNEKMKVEIAELKREMRAIRKSIKLSKAG